MDITVKIPEDIIETMIQQLVSDSFDRRNRNNYTEIILNRIEEFTKKQINLKVPAIDEIIEQLVEHNLDKMIRETIEKKLSNRVKFAVNKALNESTFPNDI